MTVAQLKELCRESGLKVSGRKQELIDRLSEVVGKGRPTEAEEEVVEADLAPAEEDESTSTRIDSIPQIEDDGETLYLEEEEEPETALREPSFSVEEEYSDDDEVFEAEILEAVIIDDDDDLALTEEDAWGSESKPARPARRPRAKKRRATAAVGWLKRPRNAATILIVVMFITAGGWWYLQQHQPFAPTPLHYGDRMDFSISDGSLDAVGDEMVKMLRDAVEGSLDEVCGELHAQFNGNGHIFVSKGTSAELLNANDRNLIGVKRALGPYGRVHLAAEQELLYDLTATLSGNSWSRIDPDDCSSTTWNMPIEQIMMRTTSSTELTERRLLRTDTELTFKSEDSTTSMRAVSYGVSNSYDIFESLLPLLSMPLKPVELHAFFEGKELKPGMTGETDSGWAWTVGDSVQVGETWTRLVDVQHKEAEECLGHARMTLYVSEDVPWPIKQKVDIQLSKSSNKDGCGLLSQTLYEIAFPDGELKARYSLDRTSSKSGGEAIDWGADYGGRVLVGEDIPEGDERWGTQGQHLPDESQIRSFTLEEAVNCILTNPTDAPAAERALVTESGYVWRAYDNRTAATHVWNVSWVGQDDAGWVLVDSADGGSNCSIDSRGPYDDDDEPKMSRQDIPQTLTLNQTEVRIISSARYPLLSEMITDSTGLLADCQIGYHLQLPPSSELMQYLPSDQKGQVIVGGVREWDQDGQTHKVTFGMDARQARMLGWVYSAKS
jgi:hypothetical protein